jgi:hypothetical protein
LGLLHSLLCFFSNLSVEFSIERLRWSEFILEIIVLATIDTIKIFLRYPVYGIIKAARMAQLKVAMIAHKKLKRITELVAHVAELISWGY